MIGKKRQRHAADNTAGANATTTATTMANSPRNDSPGAPEDAVGADTALDASLRVAQRDELLEELDFELLDEVFWARFR